MTADLFTSLRQGATLATANARLARSVRQEFNARQLAAGLAAWATPSILPWPAFIQQLWSRHAGGEPPLLTPIQEQALWESIVEASPESASLIQPQAAARLAADAWRLVHEWRVPIPGKKRLPAWEATAETSAFHGWAQQFQFHSRWLNRIDSAQQAEWLLNHAVTGPSELWLAGFDELTPRQRALLAALERTGTRVTYFNAPLPGIGAAASLAGFPNATAETEAAAAWGRRRLEANPQARIGVVVQDLEQRRPAFERAFRLATPGAFHISLGPLLAARPMVAAALRMLEFGAGQVEWETASSLLLSPWAARFGEERSRRAAYELALRRGPSGQLTASSLANHSACPPALSRALWQVDTLRRAWPGAQPPAAWSAAFAALLDAFGWPGSEPLTSEEFQVMEAWRASLSELASTGVAVQSVTRTRALEMLRRLAGNKRFEVESPGEPIQIMGLLEAAGSRFDHLWIAGMNDEVWPARPAPNPFVPLALQRQFNLPHASPARELAFAARTSQRLLQSADEVVVSYAKADTERELAPSPLFSLLPRHLTIEAAAEPVAALPDGVPFETLDDAEAPAMAEGARQSGGTRALEMQAKCPFRAFAEMRLGARELETPEAGLDPRERGGFLHTALEMFWKRLPSSAALRAAAPELATAVLAESVDAALAARRFGGDDALSARLIALERLRLIELLESWIELEKRREIEFTVEEPEQERTVEIGGLTVQVRLDRLDRLASGSYALVDYKSRAPQLADWEGERPESPQLPIYAVSAREPLAALSFAQVRTGENLFRGYSTIDGALPGAKAIEPAALAERIEEWRRVLDALGRDFRAGRAGVDPKDRFDTCKQCHLAALCRVSEKKGAAR